MEDINKVSDDLINTLCTAKKLIDKLIESSATKEAMLKSDNVDGLNELLISEENIVVALKENENERELKAKALAMAAGVCEDDARLRDVIGSIELPRCRAKLEEARKGLAEEVGKLAQQNAKLKELLQYKINYTNYMINLLYVPKSNLFSYNVQGNTDNHAGSLNLLDCRA